MYKVYYKDKDANYAEFETAEEALNHYLKSVSSITGESYDEILDEEWTSPTGVKRCVEVREEK